MLRAFLFVGDVCGYDSCGRLFVALGVISWIALVSPPEYDPRNDTKQHKTETAKQTDADFRCLTNNSARRSANGNRFTVA
jgi:hypothetical protein